METKNTPLHYVDVGAANATRELEWSYRDWPLHVTMFEPHPAAAARLRQAGRGDWEDFVVIQTALGDSSGPHLLNLAQKPEVSSLLMPNLNWLSRFPDSDRFRIVDSEELITQRLDDLELGFGPIDFMRLDTQGTEYEILTGSTNSLASCVAVQVEVEFVEIYLGQKLFGDIHCLLAGIGFEFWDFSTIYRYGRFRLDRTGQAVFADALFFRPPEVLVSEGRGPEAIEMLRRVATVFGKTDVAMRCREFLDGWKVSSECVSM